MLTQKIIAFVVVMVGWLFSLCLHEFSHSVVAYWGGDTSVKDKGYLTFNPLKYTHPVYSLLLPLVFLVLGGIGLPGGAVYIETWRLRNKWWQSAVSLAGPASNFVLAFVLVFVLLFAPSSPNGFWAGLGFLALLQISALVLNLIPLPPFDGYHALAPFLPGSLRGQIARFSLYITLGVFALLWYVPFINNAFWGVVGFLGGLMGLPFDLALQGYHWFRFWN